MSLLTERKKEFGFGAINILLLRSKASDLYRRGDNTDVEKKP